MAAMPSMASPVAMEAKDSSGTALTAERDVLGPRVETMSVEEATHQGFIRKGWNAGNATNEVMPKGLSSLEKRQYTTPWNCQFNSGGMYV